MVTWHSAQNSDNVYEFNDSVSVMCDTTGQAVHCSVATLALAAPTAAVAAYAAADCAAATAGASALPGARVRNIRTTASD